MREGRVGDIGSERKGRNRSNKSTKQTGGEVLREAVYIATQYHAHIQLVVYSFSALGKLLFIGFHL